MGSNVVSKIFPHDARFTRVMSILSVLNQNSGKLSLSDLSEESGTQVDMLLPQINAAKMLGLVKVKESDVFLTKLGKALNRKVEGSESDVGRKLAVFEPFKAAISISRRKKSFTAEQVSDFMAKNEVYLHVDERENANLITTILLQWAIEFNLLAYDGERKVWSRKPALG
jgi:hypothetical protein